MTRILASLGLATALAFTACDRVKLPFLKKKAAATPSPVAENVAATPSPAVKALQPAEPPKPDVNTKASVMALCYHRFEAKPRDLVILPAEFEKQLQALKDEGFTVIRMQDFLAWRRGEKSIPDKSCLITLDDGWRSGYDVAWPILKKFGYPFTMFIYTDYVKGQPKSGGQSLSWEELAELRDAGVDLQSHTVSHSDLRQKKGRLPNYEEWLRNELEGSKKMLQERLGIPVQVLAYVYGNHNAEVRAAAMKAGYEAAFTVYGQRITHSSPADALGRYAVDSTRAPVFQAALKMVGGGGAADEAGPAVSQIAASSMITQPMEGETISDAHPVLKANLATFGEIDPATVEIRLSGIGPVPAKYDPATKTVEGKVTQKLRDKDYTVLLSAKVKGGRKVEARWNFSFDPKAPAASPEPALPPRAGANAPE